MQTPLDIVREHLVGKTIQVYIATPKWPGHTVSYPEVYLKPLDSDYFVVIDECREIKQVLLNNPNYGYLRLDVGDDLFVTIQWDTPLMLADDVKR